MVVAQKGKKCCDKADRNLREESAGVGADRVDDLDSD